MKKTLIIKDNIRGTYKFLIIIYRRTQVSKHSSIKKIVSKAKRNMNDPFEIASKCNDFVVNIVPELAKKLYQSQITL